MGGPAEIIVGAAARIPAEGIRGGGTVGDEAGEGEVPVGAAAAATAGLGGDIHRAS